MYFISGEPDAPTNVQVVGISWYSVNITWIKGYDGGGYGQRFVVSHRKKDKVDIILSDLIDGPPYHIDDLLPLTEYEKFVTAMNDIDWSEPSDTIAVITEGIRIL